MYPGSAEEARALLVALGAPQRLLQHVALVGEAAEGLIALLGSLGVTVDADLVRAGVVLHDCGKVRHPRELDAPGSAHEPEGEGMLLERGVSARLSRVCMTHARWDVMEVELEDLVIALADKLWKGVRKAALEERVVQEVAARTGADRWALFIALDGGFEAIAASGDERLARSQLADG